jgi:hypothetical protein
MEAGKMSSKAKRVDELKDLIGDRIVAERKAKLPEIEKSFGEQLQRMKRLKEELDRVEKPLIQKLQKLGYNLSYSGIEVRTYSYELPEGVDRDLRRIKELLVLGRDEEAQQKIDRLVEQFSLGK